LARIASELKTCAAALRAGLTPGRVQSFARTHRVGTVSACVAAAIAINLTVVLALDAFASDAEPAEARVIEVALVSEPLPPDLPPPPPPRQPVLPRRQPNSAPARPSGPPVAQPPSTLRPQQPTTGSERGTEIDPSDFGIPGMVTSIPANMRGNACADPDPRRRPATCGPNWREATNGFDEREAREWRAARVEEMQRDLGLYNNCQSSHLGCAPTPDQTLIGTSRVTRRNGMGPGGPAGYDQPELRKPNAYHVDPGFGD
jgi:hypothetical protein